MTGELAVICSCTHARARHVRGVCQADTTTAGVYLRCDCLEFTDRGPIGVGEPTTT